MFNSMMVRLGLLSVILSLLWFSPYAVTTSADGYQLEQATIDTNVVSERQLLDEPEQAIPPSLHLFITEQQVEAARIGDIAATMQQAGKDFIWVTDNDRIIGVISSLSIVARTGESVRLYPRADTFAEVFNALKHPELGDV